MPKDHPLVDPVLVRFNLWDRDRDGRITGADFEAEGRRILRAFGESEHSPRGAAVMNGYRDFWKHLNVRAGATGTLTLEQFMRVGGEIVSEGPAAWAAAVRPHITATVQICDTDGDGKINQDEFTKWLRAVGADVDPAENFRRLDTDNDGYLTVDELCSAVESYSEGRLDIPLLG